MNTEDNQSSETVKLNLETLRDAGVHYGHQTERWNPKMMPFIFGAKNRMHIINLDLTLSAWEKARKKIVKVMSDGGQILFVGTKPQARDIVREEAERCSAFYVNNRWLGGTLSNFETIKKSIDRLRKLEELLVEAEKEESKVNLNKKEKLVFTRKIDKLKVNLDGVREMKRIPQMVFVIDINKESIAVAESRKLGIEVMALVDTNADPEKVDIAIPANDDSARTIRLFVKAIADAVIEGKDVYARRLQQLDSKTKVGENPKENGNGSHKKKSGKKVEVPIEAANIN